MTRYYYDRRGRYAGSSTRVNWRLIFALAIGWGAVFLAYGIWNLLA